MNLPKPEMQIDEFRTLRKKIFLNILKYFGVITIVYFIARGISILLKWNTRWFG